MVAAVDMADQHQRHAIGAREHRRAGQVLAYGVAHANAPVSSRHVLTHTRFLRAVECGYRPNPFHNALHAAAVLQTFHVVLHRGGLVPNYADRLGLVACYLSAIVHDFEHVGVTNDFLINTSDELALFYNDRAPMENHHLAATFRLMRSSPDVNFTAHLPKGDAERLRKMMIDLVLATDMKQHFSIINQFSAAAAAAAAVVTKAADLRGGPVSSHSTCSSSGAESLAHSAATSFTTPAPATTTITAPPPAAPTSAASSSSSAATAAAGPAPAPPAKSMFASRKHTSLFPASEQHQQQSSSGGGGGGGGENGGGGGVFSGGGLSGLGLGGYGFPWAGEPARRPVHDAERVLALQMALKVSDLSNFLCTTSVYTRWVGCLEEEMFRQGDREKRAGLAVSPLSDRDKPGVSKSQVGFIEIVVIPLYRAFTDVFGGSAPILAYAMRNYRFWKDISDPPPVPAPAAA
ncbi:MAG: hypothetical protein WDW36_008274 [Sanguina aurantia]